VANGEHDRAQAISAAAADLLARGRTAEARAQFSTAADLELEAFRRVPVGKPRTRGILAVSAAALLYKARRYDEAENAIYSFLVERELTTDARTQLRELLEVIWDERALPPGFEYSGDEFFVTLRNGEVGSGTAPLGLVIEKSAEFGGLTTRVLEWKAGRPFRVSGPAEALITDRVQARAGAQLAGSYRFLIRLVAPAQVPLFPDMPSVTIQGVADSMFSLIRHAASGGHGSAQELKRLIPDEQYRTTMLKIVRNIVPTGRSVGEVEISRVTKGTADGEPLRASVSLTKDTRPILAEIIRSTSSQATDERAQRFKGTLRAVDLDRDWLVVVKPDGTSIRCEGAGASVDEIVGPLVNRRVILHARRRGISRKLHFVDIEPDPDVP
jgi:hypothetical protein